MTEILLVVPGDGNESIGQKAVIESDTTVADLLQAAHLNPNEWQLQIKQGEKTIPLSSQDRVADHVQAGGKVFAFPSDMVVGSVK